jgi:hydroxymethylbilane synthase
MTNSRLVIATRQSPLALSQANQIKSELNALHPDLTIELLGITTQADKRLDVNLMDIGGKGLFVKELEEALFDGRADIAVHSMKDVPMELPPGLCIAAISKRIDPRDVYISNRYESLVDLPPRAIIGTSSLRRQTQLRALHPSADMRDLRGNIQTRLARLDKGDFDVIILASAGLMRMQLMDRITAYLSTDQVLPSAGQGALGIETRLEDVKTRALIAPLNHQVTHDCVIAERALCRKLGGGCRVPTAAYADMQGGTLMLRGLVANRDGKRVLRAQSEGDASAADQIGVRVAENLILQGAERILREFND